MARPSSTASPRPRPATSSIGRYGHAHWADPTAVLVRERGRPYRAGDAAAERQPSPASEGSVWGSTLAGLEAAAAQVAGVDLDALTEGEVRSWLAGLQRQLDRLEGVKRRSTSTLQKRAVQRQGAGRSSRARRDVDDFLREQLRLSPSDAKRASKAGREFDAHPALAKAVDDGRLRPDHVEVIAAATRDLEPELAEQVQGTLTDAATGQDPTELGRTARRLLAEVAPETAERDQARSFDRRYARLTPQADGSLLINARVAAGLDAEVAQTWIDKYRTPDGQDEHRSPEQRTCDAMLTGMRAGLDDPCGPTVQGVSPHVTVVVTLADLMAGVGTGEATWSGPIQMSEVERLLRTSSLSTIVLDDASLPLEVSKARQQSSVGLWRALVARDGGCRYPGCTAPPSWCDVAHAEAPARAGGKLSPRNAVLLCRRHHRRVDQPGWAIHIRGPDISFHTPAGRTIRAGPPQRTALATARAQRRPRSAARSDEGPE